MSSNKCIATSNKSTNCDLSGVSGVSGLCVPFHIFAQWHLLRLKVSQHAVKRTTRTEGTRKQERKRKSLKGERKNGGKEASHRKERRKFVLHRLFVPSSCLLLVVRPGAPTSVLAPSSDALCSW